LSGEHSLTSENHGTEWLEQRFLTFFYLSTPFVHA